MAGNTPPPATPADTVLSAPAVDPGPPLSNPANRPPADDTETRSDARVPGVADDAVIIIPSHATPPMRQPEGAWALLVTALDMIEPDGDPGGDELNWPDAAVLFAGRWLRERPQPQDAQGDLVVQLHPWHRDPAGRINAELLWAHNGRWRVVGTWHDADTKWGYLVAPTAAAIMSLQESREFTLCPARGDRRTQ